MSMSDAEFDRLAEQELSAIERALSDLDPDEVELDFSSGVLTLSFPDKQKLIINSHRAAGQIWMAAFRTAWHFSPRVSEGKTSWRTETEELRSTLAKVLGERLGRAIPI